MKRFKIVKKLILVLVFLISLTSIIKVYGATNEFSSLQDMGTYTQTATVMKRVKVNIKLEMKEFIESTGEYVYTLETKHYFLGIS